MAGAKTEAVQISDTDWMVIKKYKNDQYPNIAVTVDLLTTGIDVPPICNLVFMRKINSRILFEQMMGRATRLCPEIKKTHFNIFDAAKVYEDLDDTSGMKSVSVNKSMEELMEDLSIKAMRVNSPLRIAFWQSCNEKTIALRKIRNTRYRNALMEEI